MPNSLNDPALPRYARVVVTALFITMLAALGWALAALGWALATLVTSTAGILTLLFAVGMPLSRRSIVWLWRRRRG